MEGRGSSNRRLGVCRAGQAESGELHGGQWAAALRDRVGWARRAVRGAGITGRVAPQAKVRVWLLE